jgi:hypothetical protein
MMQKTEAIINIFFGAILADFGHFWADKVGSISFADFLVRK